MLILEYFACDVTHLTISALHVWHLQLCTEERECSLTQVHRSVEEEEASMIAAVHTQNKVTKRPWTKSPKRWLVLWTESLESVPWNNFNGCAVNCSVCPIFKSCFFIGCFSHWRKLAISFRPNVLDFGSLLEVFFPTVTVWSVNK